MFISVDVECSGTIPGFFDLLSIGAVPVRRRPGGCTIGAERFYVELKPVLGTSDPASMKVNGLDLQRLAREGMEPAAAARAFADFVISLSSPRDPPAFVGYCANFDWGFVNDLFHKAGIANPFGYKALDLRSLALGLFDLEWERVTQTRLLRLLDMEALPAKDAHHALADAAHQAEMFVRLIDRRAEIFS